MTNTSGLTSVQRLHRMQPSSTQTFVRPMRSGSVAKGFPRGQWGARARSGGVRRMMRAPSPARKPIEPRGRPADDKGMAPRHAHPRGRALSQRTLAYVLALNLVYFLVEVVAGWRANSLALLSDAGHMLGD